MSFEDEDQQAEHEMRRQFAIDKAVQAADRIILEASDGSCEETDYLTAQVAARFTDKALRPFSSALLRKDLGL
jgi:hypothetical protein